MKKETVNKTLLYAYDPDETYAYDAHHGTEYPYNGFPKGENGRVFKKTRFIDWTPVPEDVIIRHSGKQIIVMFHLLFPGEIIDPALEIFQLRSKRSDVQNRICEMINFFCALYDPDNELITNMLAAKYMTDSQTYTIENIKEYFEELYRTLFSGRILDKIRLMTEENDVGDVILGLFHPEFLRDTFMLSFMIKVMHIFIEHFIKLTGNSPRDQYELFAGAYIYAMNQLNPNMHPTLYQYVNKSVKQSIKSNANVYDMQALDGLTAPTIAHTVIRKSLLVDSLIKLTYASTWDSYNKRPVESCVGFITSVVDRATSNHRRAMLRFALVSIDDPAQLLADVVTGSSPMSIIRSFNAGEFTCMSKDLNSVIAQIAMNIDLSPLDFYLKNLQSLKNFELVELVEDKNNSEIIREGNVYTDIHGNTYGSYKLALLSGNAMINQDIKYVFNTSNHKSIHDYTKGITGDPKNIDIEDDIFDTIDTTQETTDKVKYNEMYNLPSINGVTVYNMKSSNFGINEISLDELSIMLDKVWKKEIMTNSLFVTSHRSSTNDEIEIILHEKPANVVGINDNRVFVVYASGLMDKYFTLYITTDPTKKIHNTSVTQKIIPFIKVGTYVVLDKKYQGMWLCCSEPNVKPIKL